MYEWGTIVCLAAPILLASALFGATRYWILGPLLFCSFIGLALCAARPFFSEELREVRIPPGWGAGALFFLYGLMLIPLAPAPHDGRVEMLKIGSYLGAYWAWTELTIRYRRWRYLFSVVILVVAVIALYALIQHLKESPLVWLVERDEGYGLRASGTFLSPNHFASMLGMIIPLCVVLVSMPASGAFLRLIAGYTLLVSVPALFLSQSRAGWIGAVCGVGVAAGLLLWKKKRRAFWYYTAGLPVLIALLAGLLWFASPTFQERVSGAMPASLDLAAQIRLTAWQDSWEMIQEKPLLGHGPGSYRWIYPSYQSWTFQRWLRYAHNEYIHTVAEFGFVGLLLGALFAGCVLYRFLRAYARSTSEREYGLISALMGCLAAALAHAFFDFNLHVFSHGHVLALIAGITAASLFVSGSEKARPLSSKPGFALGVIGAAGGVIMALSSLQFGLSDIFIQRGNTHRENLRFPAAEQAYASAARIDPGHWEPHLKLADLYRIRAHWERDPEYKRAHAGKALDHYQKTLDRNSGEMDAVFGIGTTWDLLGEGDRSVKYMRQASAYAPNNLYYATQLGLQLRQMGRIEEALDVFRDAQRIDPHDRVVRINIRTLERALERQRTEATAAGTP